MDSNLNNKDKKPQGKGKMSFSIYWMYGIIAIVLFGIYYAQENSVGKEVGWSELESYALQGGVKNIVVDGKTVKAELTDSLAKVVFGKDAVLANGAKAHVSAEAPSRDRASDKIDQWRAAG